MVASTVTGAEYPEIEELGQRLIGFFLQQRLQAACIEQIGASLDNGTRECALERFEPDLGGDCSSHQIALVIEPDGFGVAELNVLGRLDQLFVESYSHGQQIGQLDEVLAQVEEAPLLLD